MMKNIPKIILFLLGVLAPIHVFGALQINPTGEDLGTKFGLPKADLPDTVVNFVVWVLGFLGLAAVIMIIYGGYLYLTAGGEKTQVDRAKSFIKNSVIGIVIVLLAWAIVSYATDLVLTKFVT